MDKEEMIVAITEIKGDLKALTKDVADLKRIYNECDSFIKKMVIRSVLCLLFMGGSGMLFGWHMSPDMRKALLDWVSK